MSKTCGSVRSLFPRVLPRHGLVADRVLCLYIYVYIYMYIYIYDRGTLGWSIWKGSATGAVAVGVAVPVAAYVYIYIHV